MPEKFDPYSVWLSIPAGRRPPDNYQLLGLAPLESDLFRIVTSADRQISRVLPHLTGEHGKAARSLLEELLTAKGYLITPAAKTLYDGEFRKRLAKSDSPEDAALLDMLAKAPPAKSSPVSALPVKSPPTPPPPEVASEAPPVVAPPKPPVTNEGIPRAAPISGNTGVMMATAVPRFAESHLNDEPLTDPEPVSDIEATLDSTENNEAPRFVPRRLPRNNRRAGGWLGPAIAFFLAVAVVGLAAGVAWQRGFRLQVVSADSSHGNAPNDASVRDHAGAHATLPTQTGGMESPSVSPVLRTSSERQVDSSSSAASVFQESPGVENPTPPQAEPPPDKSPSADVKSAKPALATNDSKRPLSSDAETAAKLKSTLALAREALAARDIAAADKHLRAADAQATSPELMARVEAARLVRDYVDGFWNAVRESTKTLKGGEEFTVRDKVIAIVDANPNRIVLRAAGQNREYKLNDLPPHMATALAERWLDPSDANSKVFVGAFWMVDPKIEPGLANGKLTDAVSAGAKDAAAIIELLDAPW